MDILLKNGYVVTPVEYGFKVEKKDIYVKGGKITNKVIKTPHKILDLQGRVVLPGLINAHHHFYSMLSKGIPAKGYKTRSPKKSSNRFIISRAKSK